MADKKSQNTERFTSQALDDAERGSAIVKVVTKRIRAASKRLKKIEATEAKAQGQPDNINQDQVDADCRLPFDVLHTKQPPCNAAQAIGFLPELLTAPPLVLSFNWSLTSPA